MSTDHTHNTAVLATRLAPLAAIVAVIVGAMVLVGWAFDIAVLKSVLPGWISMKANTAACFILVGIALWLTARQQPAIRNPQSAIFLARLCGLLAGLIALLTLGEYLFGWNPGFDQWLFREPVGTVGTPYPGRMAPETALSFVLLSVALWVTGGSRKTRWAVLASVIPGLLAAMLSYATPGLGAYGWFGFTIMAMHATVLFAMLGVAVIAVSWQPDVLKWSLSRNTTAMFACGIAVLVLIGINANLSQFWLGEINRKMVYSEEVLADIRNLLIEVVDAQAHTRGYVITGDERFKTHYLEAQANSNVKLNALRKLVVGNPHQQQQLALIEARVNAELQWFQQVIDASQSGMTDAARNNMINHREDLLGKLRITFGQIENEHRQLIGELKQESKSVARFSYISSAAGTLASMLIFLAVIFRLNFAVNERRQKKRALQESEEKFRKITESAQDAVIMMGVDQRISFWNVAAERIFGYTTAEAMGQELHALIAPAPARSGVTQGFPHFQQTGEGPIIGKVRELTALRKSGEEFPAELSVSATQFGDQWHAIGIVRDITERKQAERILRDSSESLHRLLNSMAEGAYGVDTNGNCTFVNRPFLQMLGYQSENEVLGKHIHELIHHSHVDGSAYPSTECRAYLAYRSNQ